MCIASAAQFRANRPACSSQGLSPHLFHQDSSSPRKCFPKPSLQQTCMQPASFSLALVPPPPPPPPPMSCTTTTKGQRWQSFPRRLISMEIASRLSKLFLHPFKWDRIRQEKTDRYIQLFFFFFFSFTFSATSVVRRLLSLSACGRQAGLPFIPGSVPAVFFASLFLRHSKHPFLVFLHPRDGDRGFFFSPPF